MKHLRRLRGARALGLFTLLATHACVLEPWTWSGAPDDDVPDVREVAAVRDAPDDVPPDAPDAYADRPRDDASESDRAPVASCGAGLESCGGACVSLASDRAHCGACGRVCPTVANAASACARAVCSFTCNVGAQDCDGDAANGCEAVLATSVSHCGACGNACAARPHARPTCAAGSCGLACDAGYADCDMDDANGCEAALDATPAHCGACGRACPAGANATATCTAARCGLACAPGYADCDTSATTGCEATLATDPRNCGACGVVCPAGNVCSGGRCQVDCVPSETRCAGSRCANLTTSPTDCGACGNACPARPNARPACVASACALVCEDGWGDCDGSALNGCETDLRVTAARCGSCATACPTPANAAPVCRASACGYTCAAGFADCDGSAANGCEANLQSSVAACGACGSVCPTRPHTVPTCAAGRCGATPIAGWGDCDGDVTNGAETALTTSVSHCGACGRACVAAPNTAPTCTGGVCAAGPCATGFADCDGSAANGCEVDLRTSAAHCGSCGAACPAGGVCAASTCACPAGATACAGVCRVTATDASNCGACGRVCALANATAACASGGCVVASCNAGYADCDGNPANGCEVDTRTNTQHCGACRNVCPAATGATAVCAAGVCAVSTAVCSPSTRADCDRVASNGCEVDTTVDVSNCGSCGSRCAYANAAATCFAGRCAMGACDANFADCDGNPANGCEVDTRTSTAHCGACGRACPGGASCAAGACACPAGWTVCAATCRNTAVDASNCGACGRSCALANATAACAGGGCVIASCNPGYADCDGTPANGCETDLRTDTANCGACARRCVAANALVTCVAGACDFRCNANFADCDRASANGCEVDTRTDAGNCGACGAACAASINGGPAVSCSAGACGDLAQVASGTNTVCARRSAGTALCWGQNAQQQAGVATPTRLDTPALVSGVTGALQLALGDTHGIARGPTMRGWGTNTYGQIATQYVATTPLAVSGCCSAPRAVSVVAGWEHTCAVTDTGGVGCWGRNQRGQLGDGTTTTAAAGTISAAVTARTATGALTGVASLALGRYHTCALTAGQRVYCWGDNTYGELGRAASATAQTTALPVLDSGGAELTGVQEITAGDGFTCARISGAVRCWGDNLRGSTGSPSAAREVATPTVVPDITDATAIAAGQYFACALRTGGRVHCWGGNLDGQAGQPASSIVYASALSLVRYADGAAVTDAVSLALGASHACAATAQGALVCWGRNYDAQLGDGTRVSRDRAARARWPVY